MFMYLCKMGLNFDLQCFNGSCNISDFVRRVAEIRCLDNKYKIQVRIWIGVEIASHIRICITMLAYRSASPALGKGFIFLGEGLARFYTVDPSLSWTGLNHVS